MMFLRDARGGRRLICRTPAVPRSPGGRARRSYADPSCIDSGRAAPADAGSHQGLVTVSDSIYPTASPHAPLR